VHIRFYLGVLRLSRSPYRRRRHRCADLRGLMRVFVGSAYRGACGRASLLCGRGNRRPFVPPWRLTSGTLPNHPGSGRRYRPPFASIEIFAILEMGTRCQQFKPVRQSRHFCARGAFARVVQLDERMGLTADGFCLPPPARGIRGLNERAVRSPAAKERSAPGFGPWRERD